MEMRSAQIEKANDYAIETRNERSTVSAQVSCSLKSCEAGTNRSEIDQGRYHRLLWLRKTRQPLGGRFLMIKAVAMDKAWIRSASGHRILGPESTTHDDLPRHRQLLAASGLNWRCVVEAEWMISDRTYRPSWRRAKNARSAVHRVDAGIVPAFDSKGEQTTGPLWGTLFRAFDNRR